MINELLKFIFRTQPDSTRQQVKRRLQVVIAQDRYPINNATLSRVREDILTVISKYMEIDYNGSEFSLEINNKITTLIANIPIKRLIHLK